jgi:hypothetical protein
MPSDEAVINACNFIPHCADGAVSANEVAKKANRPRMQMREVEALCEWQVEQGEMRVIVVGVAHKTYCWNDRNSPRTP